MTLLTTVDNLKQFFISDCDFTPKLAQLFYSTCNYVASKHTDIHKAFFELQDIIHYELIKYHNHPRIAKKDMINFGYNTIDEMMHVLSNFSDSAYPEEIFQEYIKKDENEDKKVWKKDDYSIYVNDLKNATYVSLFKDNKKIGSLSTGGTYIDDNEKWLKVSLADILKGYRGYGLGKQLYIILLKYSNPEYKGIVSYLPDRYNKKQIPKIYNRLGGYTIDDYAFIPR